MHEFTEVRETPASPGRVFRSWTDPEHLTWLFNPAFPTDEPVTVDLRVGGAWRQRMIVDDSTNYVTGGIYREIEPDRRLVFAWGATDGWPEVDPDNFDAGPIATVTLVDNGGGTTMTLHLVVPDDAWHPYMRDGWSETIDRLIAQLA